MLWINEDSMFCSICLIGKKFFFKLLVKVALNEKVIPNLLMIKYTWIPCKLVIPSHFISWKNSFSDISRKCILPKND